MPHTPFAQPLPRMAGPPPKPANDRICPDQRPDERKEGGPDFGRGLEQADHADKSRRDAATPEPVAPDDAPP